MITILWLKSLLQGRPGRLLGAIIGVALTVALLASIGAFTVDSAASMTERAIAPAPNNNNSSNLHLAICSLLEYQKNLQAN